MTIIAAIVGWCYLMDTGHTTAAQVLVWSTFAQVALAMFMINVKDD